MRSKILQTDPDIDQVPWIRTLVRHEEIELGAGDHRVFAERMLVGEVVAHDRLEGDLVVFFGNVLVRFLKTFRDQGSVWR